MIRRPPRSTLSSSSAASDVYKRQLLDIRPPEEIPALLDLMNQVHLGFNCAGVWRHRRKHGSLLFAEIRAFRFEQDGHPYELVLANNVTERKLMEEALRQSQASLQSLVD